MRRVSRFSARVGGACNVGIVYRGMNLYNNGFAGGIVAMFLVPVIQSIRDRRGAGKRSVAVRFPLFNGILTRKRHRDIVSIIKHHIYDTY